MGMCLWFHTDTCEKEQSTAQGCGNSKGKERSQVLIFFTFSIGEKVGRDLQGGERQQVRKCC